MIGLKIYNNFEEGLRDVVMTLRIEKESMKSQQTLQGDEFFKKWGSLKKDFSWQKADAIVMRLDPVNRELEIASEVAHGPQDVTYKQVTFGVAVCGGHINCG